MKLKQESQNFQQTKVLDQMASQVVLLNIQRTNTYPSQTISKASRGGKAPTLILQGHHYSNSQNR